MMGGSGVGAAANGGAGIGGAIEVAPWPDRKFWDEAGAEEDSFESEPFKRALISTVTESRRRVSSWPSWSLAHRTRAWMSSWCVPRYASQSLLALGSGARRRLDVLATVSTVLGVLVKCMLLLLCLRPRFFCGL